MVNGVHNYNTGYEENDIILNVSYKRDFMTMICMHISANSDISINPRPDEVWRVTRPDEGVAQRAPLRIFKSKSRRVKIQTASERSRRTLQNTIMFTLFLTCDVTGRSKKVKKGQNVLIYSSQQFVT